MPGDAEPPAAGRDLVGLVGRMVLPARASSPGEVVLTVHGCTETYIAVADAPVDRGAEVLVVAALGPRRVAVQPWMLGGDLAPPVPG